MYQTFRIYFHYIYNIQKIEIILPIKREKRNNHFTLILIRSCVRNGNRYSVYIYIFDYGLNENTINSVNNFLITRYGRHFFRDIFIFIFVIKL